MSMSRAKKLTIIVCGVILVLKIVFILSPTPAFAFFNQFVRPFIYATLALAVYVFLVPDKRPRPNEYQARMVALITVGMYGMVFIMVVYLFGGGRNVHQPGTWLHFSRAAWSWGTIVILGELIRVRLIRATNNNATIVTWLTLVLGVGLVIDARAFIRTEVLTGSAFFFGSFLIPMASSIVASLFALKGSLLGAVLISGIFNLTASLMPLMPHLQVIPWTLINLCMLFVSGFMLHIFTNNTAILHRARLRRAARYEKKSPLGYAATVGFIIVAIAFFLGYFPFYPVVILTRSMTGTFDQGSVVFIQRVPSGEAFTMVGEGAIIHFEANNMEWVHRVIDFRHDDQGNRVFITQGDANYLVDPFVVRENDVLGVAHNFLPFAGWPYLFFRVLLRGPIA